MYCSKCVVSDRTKAQKNDFVNELPEIVPFEEVRSMLGTVSGAQ